MVIGPLLWLSVLAAALVLVILSLRLLPGSTAEPMPGGLSRFFLVALRLAIGWHFFIEAAEKLHDASWSSEGYLRESTGPLAPLFRDIAGDRLIEQLTLQSDASLAPELESRWQAYVNALAAYYELDEAQTKKAQEALDETKKDAAQALSSRPRRVQLITAAEGEEPVFKELTMPERLKKYEQLKAEVRRLEEQDLPHYAEDAQKQWKTAKGNAAKWRSAMQRDLDLLDRGLKRSERDVLLAIARDDLPTKPKLEETLKKAKAKREGGEAVPEEPMFPALRYALAVVPPDVFPGGPWQQALREAYRVSAKGGSKKKVPAPPKEQWERVDAEANKYAEEDLWTYRKAFAEVRDSGAGDKLKEQTKRIHQYVIDVKKAPATSYDFLPKTVTRPMGQWKLLDWGDFAVKWGLLIVGGCLLAGFFTRTACVLGALYLLMFYLAMPALPGWPESPRAEGHYLFINKNIIEMLALLALATFRTGKWVGLDGLLGLLWARRSVEDQPDLAK